MTSITKCDNKDCIGGRAFNIRELVFCSPKCGNEYYELSPSDEDYWNDDDESDDESDDDEGNQCYGVEEIRQKRFIMSGGGSHWWNYVVDFDTDGKQTKVYVEDKDGLQLQKGKRLLQFFNREGDERLKLVDESYELNEKREECWIYNYSC